MNKLDYLRENLEMCDEIILDALTMRYRMIEDITAYKRKKDLPIVQPEEEEKKRRLLLSRMTDHRHTDNVMDVFDSIILNSKKIQSQQLFDYNIVLIGFMGSGKSTISRALSKVFAMDVIEMDQVIADREGMSISEIFEVHGEEYFRNLETELLREMQNRKGVVISCGGGVPMRDENVVEMKKNGKVILLTAAPETILERVKNNHDRPLLENNKNVDFISELMEKRRSKYEAAADIIIQTDGKSEFEICEEIISHAKKQ
ncbi:MAG: shikimate kinase [Lachnospiraceae bacterium]|nr:shikimate kinase [bacterium]MDY5518082.1 shikimate kinase [Lachnospiraceae bacterium]